MAKPSAEDAAYAKKLFKNLQKVIRQSNKKYTSESSTPLWRGTESASIYETPQAQEMMEEYKASPEHQAVKNESVGWTSPTKKQETDNEFSISSFIPMPYKSPDMNIESKGQIIPREPLLPLTYKWPELDIKSKAQITPTKSTSSLPSSTQKLSRRTLQQDERNKTSEVIPQEATSGPQEKASFGTWFRNNALAGLNQFNKGLLSTLDWLLPTEYLGKYDFIGYLNDLYGGMYDTYSEKAYNAGVSRGEGWKYGGDLLQGTVAALPNAVIALMTSGLSLGGSALSSGSFAIPTAAGSTSHLEMLKNAVTEMSKNPLYWSSFLQTVGTDYEQAKQNGANEFTASTSAIITSLLNAGIEVGGGIEQLPNSVRQGGKRAVLNWVTSSADEGKENVLQGIVTDGIARLMYDTDRDTLNLEGRLYDFAMGTGVGGILGGAQMGAMGTANRLLKTNTAHNTEAGTKVDPNIGTKSGVKENTDVNRKSTMNTESSTDTNTKGASTGVNDNASGVKYFTGNVINDNNMSIKDQLRNSAEKINSMEPVYRNDSIYVTDKGRAENLNEIMKIFEDIDYKVERSDIGTIVLDKKRISNSLRYLQTDGELAAYSALPDVLEKGVEINYKEEHKRRPYETFTFAAPVVINGQEGYMGVVVRRDNGTNYYKVHRILMPDGSTFVYENRINSAERAAGHSQDGMSGSPAVAVYDNNISQQSPIVNSSAQNNVDNEQINRSYENYNPNEAQALIKSLDKNGLKAFDTAYENEVSKGNNMSRFEFLRRYNRYYVAGLTGRSKAQVDRLYADSISQSSANAAYRAGQADRALQLDRENAQINKVVKNEGGLYKNANSEKLSSDTASFIDKMAKDLGVGVEFLDDVKTKGGKSVNGQYSDGKIKISMKTLNDSRIDSSELKNKIAQQIFKHEINAKSQESIEKAVDDIMKNVGEQMPATWLDKWNAWRYLAMLGNPRTHIRNVVGNAIFAPAVATKNFLGYIGESAVNLGSKAARGKGIEKSKNVFIPKKYKNFASTDFKMMADSLTGGGKYNFSDQIKDNQKIFKFKPLEKFRVFNENLLEAEDRLFLKTHYINALSSFLSANKIDIDTLTVDNEVGYKQLERARDYAIKEAQKATFRDASDFANALNRFSKTNRVTNLMVESLLPFKKTPANILKRGIEYSPVTLLDTITRGSYRLAKGEMTVNDFIDRLSTGLTGTGIMALGYFLASMGILKGSSKDDKEEFEEMQGTQTYALYFGEDKNKSYTVDWAAPMSLPLFVGAELSRLMKDGESMNVSTLLDSLATLSEPIFELSMLDGLENTLAAPSKNPDDKAIVAIVREMLTGYMGQAVPTILGQTTRTFFDDKRRRSYADKNSNIPTWAQYSLQSQANKVPGLSKMQQPYVDAWGKEDDTGSLLERAFENYFSPGYYSEKNISDIDMELMRLSEQNDINIYPKTAPKYFNINNTRKDLTAKEYTKVQKTMGQKSYDLISSFYNNEIYNELDDEQKIDVIEKLYDISSTMGKKAVSDYESSSAWIEDAITKGDDAVLTAAVFKVCAPEYASIDSYYKALENGLSLGNYIEYIERTDGLSADKDENGNSITGSKQQKLIAIIDSMDLSNKEKAYLFSTEYENPKNNPWKNYLN